MAACKHSPIFLLFYRENSGICRFLTCNGLIRLAQERGGAYFCPTLNIEKMEPKTVKRKGLPRHYRLTILVGAMLLIAVGVLTLGRNLGFVDRDLFRILVSGPMFVIVLGIWTLFLRRWVNGVILISAGIFFLIPRVLNVGGDWIGTYWPLVFVLAGLILLIRIFHPERHSQVRHSDFSSETSTDTQDGFVDSHNSFSSVRHIVLDPVFRGARIKSSFGGTIIDLRKTTLEAPETYIDIEASFSGIELYIPGSWTVVDKIVPMLGGIDDKRFNPLVDPNSGHKLILRGNITCSGVEIKG